MKLKVAEAKPTGGDVVHLAFVHPLRPELPAWTAGAHVDLRLGEGRVRQYSLCGDPADRSRYEIAVKLEHVGRGGSAWVHANLPVGAIAHVSAPRNNFPLIEAARRHVFIAGGIGVTPFLAMARALQTSGQEYELHFCARSAAEAPLLDSLMELCGPRLRTWFSSDGARFAPTLIGQPDDDTHLYLCGPKRLLDAVCTEAAAMGWPDDHIHAEVFRAEIDETFKPEPFEVRLASTGAVLHVPADRSILDILRDHGIHMASSCELGVCGSCICGYSEGSVIHRDAVLPVAARQNKIAPCVSRARVSVTLDL